jgi:hypothetical protein
MPTYLSAVMLISVFLGLACCREESTTGAMEAQEQGKHGDPVTLLSCEQLSEEIARTVIPEVQINDATFEEVLDFVIQSGGECRPALGPDRCSCRRENYDYRI